MFRGPCKDSVNFCLVFLFKEPNDTENVVQMTYFPKIEKEIEKLKKGIDNFFRKFYEHG